MMVSSGFYIDVNKASKRRILQKVRVRLNGKLVNRVIAAKSGKNGFVEFYADPLKVRGEDVVTRKVRGLVKISINKWE